VGSKILAHDEISEKTKLFELKFVVQEHIVLNESLLTVLGIGSAAEEDFRSRPKRLNVYCC